MTMEIDREYLEWLITVHSPIAQAIVAECPAEETPLTLDECFIMARQLIGDNDLELQFVVFVALWDRNARLSPGA
jgi:hypothetical protein